MSPYQRTLQMYCPFIAEEPSQNGEGCSFRVRGHRLSQIPCVLRGFSPVGCTSTPRVHRYSVTPVACGRVCPLPEDKELPTGTCPADTSVSATFFCAGPRKSKPTCRAPD